MSKFAIDIIGDIDLDGIAVEIIYNDLPVAMLTYEKGIQNSEIEIYTNYDKNWNFSLEEFCTILEKAKKILVETSQNHHDS